MGACSVVSVTIVQTQVSLEQPSQVAAKTKLDQTWPHMAYLFDTIKILDNLSTNRTMDQLYSTNDNT